MLNKALPTTLDVRKAAARGLGVGGVLRPQDLARFRPLLAGDEGIISAEMQFSRDEDNRHLICVTIEAEVLVVCQRCLETMREHFCSESTLAVVWTDEEAAHLPRHLDPLLETEPSTDLWSLVEDELILAMPAFSYHDAADCKQKTAAFSDASVAEKSVADKSNPFIVLGQLKPEK